MTPFTTLTSVAALLPRDNVDTDAIIPSREMKTTGRTGLADGLFAPWRYQHDRIPHPEFVLNQPHYAHAQILLGGANFGCGSSREHAVWALAEWGFRAIVAESFAPIFRNNCVRNGVLPVVLDRDVIAALAGRTITIDLQAQTVDGYSFEIDAEAKTMLLEGLDAIDLTLKHAAAIEAWTERDRLARPWVYLASPSQMGRGPSEAGEGVRTSPRTRRLSDAAVAQARQLRRQLSPPERLLREELGKRPGGFKWRCQHPLPPYTLDFYCPSAKLCVEVDGDDHGHPHRARRDARRDQWLAERQIVTVRIRARDIWQHLESVVNHITDMAASRAPHPHAAHGSSPRQAGEAF